MRQVSGFVMLLVSTVLTGCGFQNKTSVFMPIAPSSVAGALTGSGSPGGSTASSSSNSSSTGSAGSEFSGTWASGALPGLPSITSCTDLHWSIANQSATTVAGSVSAVCGGVATVTANLTGQLTGSDVVNLTANGSAVALGLTCGFTLTGVGHMETHDALRLDFQGTTCLGPVSGSEMLRRAVPAPAPSAPPPPPEPEPQIDPHDPLFDCIHRHIRPTNEHSAFEVTKRVAWALRNRGGAGLLLKPIGENIVTWRGYTVAAGRICFPDGHIYKVLTDVGPGGANGPSWQDEGFVDRNRYLPALDPDLP
jgi:hypothetical protein